MSTQMVVGLCFACHNAQADALMESIYQFCVVEKNELYCGGELIAIKLHSYGKGFTVDQAAIIRRNNNMAALKNTPS